MSEPPAIPAMRVRPYRHTHPHYHHGSRGHYHTHEHRHGKYGRAQKADHHTVAPHETTFHERAPIENAVSGVPVTPAGLESTP